MDGEVALQTLLRISVVSLEILAMAISLSAQQVRIANAGAIPNNAMIPPTILQSTLAPYTGEALNRSIEGVVTVQADIDAQGSIKVLRVVQGLGYGLDESATRAVANWVFSPALRNGVPIETVCLVDVYFNPRAENALRVGYGVSAPTVLHRVEPQYTAEARAAHANGVVVLQALVRKDGVIDILRVVRGLGYGLTESAIEALQQWKLKPGLGQSGQPVDISLNIEINFHLK
jgi:TonB family protein